MKLIVLTIFSSLSLALALLSMPGCVSRAQTKARSQIIQELESAGQPVKTIEQEKEAFVQHEEIQKERLLSVLEKRSSGEYRDATYRIGANDEVEINVFDVPELNLTARVGQAGFLSLPLVGAVQAAGKTELELQQDLRNKLSSFVKNPQASVAVSNYGSQKVAVMGAVAKPGSYPLRKGTNSVLELLSEAGGLTEKASNYLNFVPAELSGVAEASDAQSRARLAFQTQSPKQAGTHSIEIYLDHILGTTGTVPLEIPVKGGDMIIVPESGKIMVDGEVEKPGSYELGQRMSLLGALAASGGITYGAKIDEIEVIRETGFTEKAHLVVDLEQIAAGEATDVRLRNGDVVRVPSESGRRLRQDTFEGITKIINFGIGGSVNLAN